MAIAVAARMETAAARMAMVAVVAALKTGEGREQTGGGQADATAS